MKGRKEVSQSLNQDELHSPLKNLISDCSFIELKSEGISVVKFEIKLILVFLSKLHNHTYIHTKENLKKTEITSHRLVKPSQTA